MAYLPELHYCHFPGCGKYLGSDDGDADCGEHDEEEWERVAAAEEGDYPGEGNPAQWR